MNKTRGICWVAARNCFRARISRGTWPARRTYNVGDFKTFAEAQAALEEFRKLLGE